MAPELGLHAATTCLLVTALGRRGDALSSPPRGAAQEVSKETRRDAGQGDEGSTLHPLAPGTSQPKGCWWGAFPRPCGGC